MKGWTTMKRLKQVICGLVACLMLADPVSVCSTAYADENEPAEPEAILQMEPVEQEGMPLLQETEKQETGAPEQAAARTADTSAPQLDMSSLHIEYDAKLGGEATLTYRVTDESEIVDVSCHIMVCANGLRTSNYIEHHGGRANKDGIVTETFRLNFYGKYEIVSISMRDVWGNATAYYNSAYSGYEGQLPAADLSIATISLPAPTEDNDPPVIDIDSIRLEKAVIANGEDNAMQLSVADATGVAELHAQFRNIENGKNADAMTITALGEGIFSLQLHRPFPGKWQLFFIDAIDVCGNTIRLIDAKHPYYSETFGTENLRDLSAIVFEVESESFATPVIDLTSISIDKNTSRNKEEVKISANVENPHSVRQFDVVYRVPTGGGDGAIVSDSVGMSYYTSGQFKGLLYPTYFGKYEVEWIELLDYSGEWQRIYNSALAYSWTLPEDTVFADLSALNFNSVDAQIYTMEDLKTALAAAKDGDELQIAASEDFVITEDITIPNGVYLNIQSGSGSFKVAKGAILTTKSRFNCYVPMTVEGAWLDGIDTTESNARSSVHELTVATGGAVESNDLSVDGTLAVCEKAELSTKNLHIFQKMTVNGMWKNRGNPYCYGGLTIGETGVVISDSWLRIDGLVTVAGVWTHNAGADLNGGLTITPTGSIKGTGRIDVNGAFINEGELAAGMRVSCTHTVTSQEELKSILNEALGRWDTIQIVGDGQEFTLTESITIPDEVYLNIQSSVGKFVVAERTILTTGSEFYCYAPMEVEGTFANTIEGCWVSLGSLLVAETGCVKVNGSTHADKILVEGTLENGGTIWVNGDLLISAAGRVTNNGSITVCGTYANDGTVEQGENGSIHRYYTVSTVEDLMAKAATAKKGDNIVLESDGKKFIVDQDVTIPDGVRLQAPEGFVVAKEVTLTTSEINASSVTVNGTWKNYGYSNLYQGLTIAEGGIVENNGYIQIDDQYENHGRLINGSNGSARLSLWAEDEAELLDALACDDPGQKEIDLCISEEMTITEDVQIPVNTALNIYDSTGEGKATLTIGEGTTLTNSSSSFNCYVPMIVAGTLTNVGGVRMEKGLTITVAGTVDTTSGWFDLTGPLVNNGTLVKGSNVHQTLEAHSADELQSALAAMASSGEVRLKSESEVVLSSDIVIPKGITVEVYESVQSLRIAAGSKLVIDAEAMLRSYAPLIVEGTVDNYGAIGARKGLSVTGKIDNYNYIRVEGNIVGAENIRDHEAGNQSIRQQYAVDSEESLTNTLNTIPVSSRDWIRLMAAEGFALTKDITIPAGVYLEIQTGEFKVNSGATLTTYDNLIVNGDMRVDGCWENLRNRTDQTGYGHSEVGGILTVNGTVKNSGHIELYQYAEALAQGKIQNSGNGTLGIGIQVSDVEELRRILNNVKDNLRMSVTWRGSDDLELDRDLTIPDGIRFYVDDAKIIIPMGVTLTVGNNAYVLADSIDVQGTLLNNGSFFGSAITESGRIVNHSFLRSDSITVSGQLTNSNSVSFSTLCIEDNGYVGNAGVLMGKIESHGRLEQTERAEENMVFNISLENSCDWKDVFANIRSGDTIVCNSRHGDAYVEITEDTTLPENVSINWLSFCVKEGVTFTTGGGTFKPDAMLVDGTWINNGSVDLDILTVNGTVRNNGQITVRKITGDKNVVGNAVANQSSNSGQYVTILDLQEALDSAEPGETIRCNQLAYGNGDSTILNTDIVVPEGVTLEFSGVSKVYLTAGHTLTVNGTLLMQQQLYVAGDLVINGEVALPSADEVDLEQVQYLGLTSGSISVIEGGSCTLNGSIRAGKTDYTGQTVENPRSLITGVAMEDLSLRDVDDYWYLTKKPAVDKAEVFCSLPVAGCKLRLVDESGNVRELMPSGGYALITDITSGAYTLEVSKPGYVTHTYKVDTTTLPDVLDVELVQTGDVNGACVGGIDVEITDLACLYQYLTEGKNEGSIQDETYFKAVADVNDDGSIDVYDLQRLYEAVSGVNGF